MNPPAHQAVLDVADIGKLERMIARDGTPLSSLMERAGEAVAQAVRRRMPAPAPVIVLAGAGNNGGDGWVAARTLARCGYPVTLVSRDGVEHLHAEPAHAAAQAALADALRDGLSLDILIAPDEDTLTEAMRGSSVIIDAILGTGFTGEEVRSPYAGWIRAAHARRLETPGVLAVAIDTPSGLSAQSGTAARPCFMADLTVTMLAYKPGLITPAAAPWTGNVELATLVDTKPYLKALRSGALSDAERAPDNGEGAGFA